MVFLRCFLSLSVTGVDGFAKSTAAEELSFAERISKNLTFSGKIEE